MSLTAMNLAILFGALLVAAAIFTSVISFRFGAPLLLVFLLLGLAAGEDGLGIEFDDAPAAYFIGSVALALILFDSGFNTRAQTLRTAAAPAGVLAVFGVALTAGFVGVAAHWILSLSWLEAFLLGAIVSSTDAAAVFFLLRTGGISLRERTRATLEVESSSNDPVAIFLTIGLIELILAGAGFEAATFKLLGDFVLQIGLGAIVGLAGGYGIRAIINRTDLDAGLFPVAFVALGLIVFAATALVGGSGFLAVYVAGLFAGNTRMRHAGGLRRFSQALTWLSQITMFLTLGLLATPSEFPDLLLPAVGLGLFLMLFARPLAVVLSILPFKFSWRETTFIGWVGLRGAVSILLGILPIVAGLPNGQVLFNVAFIIVLTSLLVQGWSIGPMARWLGLIVPPRLGPLQRTELEIPGGGGYEIVAYRVRPDSRVIRGDRLPRWARPSLIVRDGSSLRPRSAGPLQPGDQVFIMTSSRYVPLLDRLFAGAADDNLDPDLYGEFTLNPEARLRDVTAAYGAEVAAIDESATLKDFIRERLHGDVEAGDRISLGDFDLIVRSVNEGHEILEVGLSTDPASRMRPPRWHAAKSRRTNLLRRLLSWSDE